VAYKTILLNINIDSDAQPLISAAVDLAKQHDAKLIGHCSVCADLYLPATHGEALILAAKVRDRILDDLDRSSRQIQAAFDQLSTGHVKAEWRRTFGDPSQAVVELSRTADLIVMPAPEAASGSKAHRSALPGDVVLRSGRPLVLLAEGAKHFAAKKIVIAWKDTREARRAISDAIPILTLADEIIIVTVTSAVRRSDRESMEDVRAFLGGHGINAELKFVESSDEYIGLMDFIDGSFPDLVVSGAYGHTRLREWVFGGITRTLLASSINRFMSY